MKVVDNPKDKNLVNVQSLARRFGISPRTVRKYAKQGLIPNTMVTMSKKIDGKIVQYYWHENDVSSMQFYKQGFH